MTRKRKMRMAARQCAKVGDLECWHALLTTAAMSGRVMVTQRSPPTRERYGHLQVSSGWESPEVEEPRQPLKDAGL